MTYLTSVANRKQTPQSQPIPGKEAIMTANNASGFSFAVDDWTRLHRFLILGSEAGSFYATEQALSVENAQAVIRCIKTDAARVVREIVTVSHAGRAPKNDPAIFCLALVASHADDAGRKAALEALPQVCRIGTHLFHFAAYVDGMRGWGRGLRKAVADWYNDKSVSDLAYQVVKYQQRDKWSHRDLLRLSHPVPSDESRKALYHWITKGWESIGTEPHTDDNLRLVWAMERAKAADMDAKGIAKLIREYNMPRECIPTQFLNELVVWGALFDKMPMTALIRNLATLTRIGMFKSSVNVGDAVTMLTNRDALRKARVHPIAILTAMKTYQQGHGERGTNTWTPVAKIVDALDAAFYASFENIEPTNKRWMLALDVSGSMDGGTVAGVPGLTPRIASAAMAMVTARVEADYQTIAFTNGNTPMGYGNCAVTPLTITPRQRMDDIVKTVSALPFGGTDCALPMIYAEKNNIPVDVFAIYTDSETWCGAIHPSQALQSYRQKTGIPAKLIVVAMIANKFSIADPEDAGQMDFVGFDTSTPSVMADFAIS